MKHLIAIALLSVTTAPALAQSSASYRIESRAFNAGGHPQQGTVLASAGYRITLDAIGDGVVGVGRASASFRLEGSFTAVYGPPGEVTGLHLKVKDTIRWDPEPSAGTYALYRNSLGDLASGDAGQCLATNIALPLAPVPDVPAPGDGHFFLVTARNRLDEEGTKGYRSSGAERPNPDPCP